MTIFENIKTQYNTLSKSNKVIADYILQNYKTAIFLSCNELSKIIGVSDVTILRFARKLGYENYLDFLNDVRTTVMNNVEETERIKLASNIMKNYGEGFLAKEFDNAFSIQSEAASLVDDTIIQSCCDLIETAEEIAIIGFGENSFIADMAKNYCDEADIDTYIYSEHYSQSVKILTHSDKRRIAIYFCIGVSINKDERMIKRLTGLGYKIILFTSNNSLPKDIHDGITIKYKNNFIPGSTPYMLFGMFTIFKSILFTLIIKNEDATKRYFQKKHEYYFQNSDVL